MKYLLSRDIGVWAALPQDVNNINENNISKKKIKSSVKLVASSQPAPR